MSNILTLIDIKKSYKQSDETLHILQSINLEIKAGQIVSLIGQSGSGKSSLLHIAGLLDKADSGHVIIDNVDYSKANDKKRTLIRNNSLGFVYQFHHLLADFTALENVMMPQIISGASKNVALITATELLDRLGLLHRLNHFPGALSGGEQQRVAIARALSNNPKLLLADEPTGNLDPKTADLVFDLLLKEVKINNIACLIVTHNPNIANKTDVCYKLEHGKLCPQ